MLQVCLDDVELLQMLTSAAEDFARAAVPRVVFKAFQQANMTALLKRDGGVRGIATGTSFRRLVAKSLARQFSKEVERACAPFQFALSTRAGTDCVGHVIRALTDANPTATVLSVDGIGAYDHVFRGAMLSKLLSEPALHGLLPFVRAMYSEESHYTWRDDSGNLHDIVQCEGGEQGDPLMPLLFSLGIHDALSEAKNMMGEEEHLLAFLDDVFIVSEPDRTRSGYNTLGDELSTRAGIHLHAGKTRVWNREGVCPPGVEELGPEVWSPRGVKILGTPLGSDAFVQEMCEERLQSEQELWDAIPSVPDLQCAWQVLTPVCWTPLSPPPPHSSSRPILRICHEARRGNERGHGIAVAWSPR